MWWEGIATPLALEMNPLSSVPTVEIWSVVCPVGELQFPFGNS
jgi:hypothetical protein